jgi:hypothetical protein
MTHPRGWCEIARDSLELMNNKDISVSLNIFKY